jgi:hypothetical protein
VIERPAEHWPRHDPDRPGFPLDRQDLRQHPIPDQPILLQIFADLISPADLVYNR